MLSSRGARSLKSSWKVSISIWTGFQFLPPSPSSFPLPPALVRPQHPGDAFCRSKETTDDRRKDCCAGRDYGDDLVRIGLVSYLDKPLSRTAFQLHRCKRALHQAQTVQPLVGSLSDPCTRTPRQAPLWA